jgi:hypothetical protein
MKNLSFWSNKVQSFKTIKTNIASQQSRLSLNLMAISSEKIMVETLSKLSKNNTARRRLAMAALPINKAIY